MNTQTQTQTQMKIKINKEFAGYKPDTVVYISDKDYDYKKREYFKRRLNDAKFDNCCELIEEKYDNSKSVIQSESKIKTKKEKL